MTISDVRADRVYSVLRSEVQDRYCRPDEVMVRAGVRQNIEQLARDNEIDANEIVETPEADYRFRLKLKKDRRASFVMDQAASIDYPNFKNAVRGDLERLRAYHECWHAMSELQERKAVYS